MNPRLQPRRVQDRIRTCHRSRVHQRAVPARRGVASVLAMMFMVIFGSLAAAMAVVAQGNMRTADSGLKLSRAMSAAETGMIFAGKRLAAETKRFVVEKGVIDPAFGQDLWMGTYNTETDGNVTVLPPEGYTVTTPPDGIVEAVRDAHLADTHSIIVEPGDASLPAIDSVYGTLRVRPIELSDGTNSPYFRLKYEMVAGEAAVRVTSIGVDGDVQRTLQMDFELEKKIEFAILSPNRIMIGKNVHVDGPLGSRYGLVEGELDPENGDPLVLRSDFYHLDDTLDVTLDTFYQQVADYDVDGDNRLRTGHPVESAGLAGHGSLVDYDGNEYVDDVDLFLSFFDDNADMMVVYDSSLANAAGLGALSEEFVDIDNQLARLIDDSNADRDGDGEVTTKDISLGYHDGVIDPNDLYAKVRGRLAFAVVKSDWESHHGESYQTVVEGAVRTSKEDAPASFDVTEDEMREVTTDMFADSQTWFEAQVPTGSDDFESQRDASGTYTPHTPGDPWEAVPYGSSAAYDFYARDVYEGITFTNVRIPQGCNGLFIDCTFIGVTFVETNDDCSHFNWNYADAREEVEDPPGSGNYTYPLKFPDLIAELSDATPVPNTRVMSNNLRFENCVFLGSIAGSKPDEYTHWRNKLQITGETRFYSDPEDPDLLDEIDNGNPNASGWQSALNDLESVNPGTLEELQKSSILMPGWSFDVGNFTNVQGSTPGDTPKIKLKGTIIAGILDVRGTADVHGTVLMTFRPTEGEGPLYYGGLPDVFNTTIGYFEPEAGGLEGKPIEEIEAQGFGEITLRYDPNAKLPDGIPWPVRMTAVPTTYVE